MEEELKRAIKIGNAKGTLRAIIENEDKMDKKFMIKLLKELLARLNKE